jgi:leucine-rich repeat protein SHOC2
LTALPASIGQLDQLIYCSLSKNQISSLPESIQNNRELKTLDLDENPLTDLSVLASLPQLTRVSFARLFDLPRRYWTKFSEWQPQWLLSETNVEIRRMLIQQVGYEKICAELKAVSIDSWREYTLLKIDGVEKIFNRGQKSVDTEAMVLLKMTCPSTNHIHILRVPPDMTSAESAITWVNHGIHPNDLSIET